jgi:hypothetical protein
MELGQRRGLGGIFVEWRQRASPLAILKTAGNIAVIGAGEGIRTLDPDLGKVVLYH